MVLRAAERLPINLARAWTLGDRATDLAAGRAAGLTGGLLLSAGPEDREWAAASALARPGFEARPAGALRAALNLALLAR